MCEELHPREADYQDYSRSLKKVGSIGVAVSAYRLAVPSTPEHPTHDKWTRDGPWIVVENEGAVGQSICRVRPATPDEEAAWRLKGGPSA